MSEISFNHYQPKEQDGAPRIASPRRNSDLCLRMYQLNTGHHVVCFVDPSTKSRRRKKFTSKTEAKTYQRELEGRFLSKGMHAFNTAPIGQLLNTYLERFPNSRIRERKNSFLSFCDYFGTRPINEVGKTELQEWFNQIKEENDYSDRTLATIKSNINSFFHFLVDEDVLAASPLGKIKFDRKPPPRRLRVVLSVLEVRTLLENARNFSPSVFYPFLFAAAYTGARRGEVLKLKRGDIDLDSGLIHFRNTKNGEDRSVRIPKALKTFLEEHLATHTSEYAFPDPEGEMIGRQRLHRLLRRFKKHFPVGKDWGPHALRHSFAYNFLKTGGNMYQLQAILGHKSIDVTVDVYGQIAAQDIEAPCPYEQD